MKSIDNWIYDNDETIVMAGAGKKCARICAFLSKQQIDNIIIFDNDPTKWGKTIEGYIIDQPKRWQNEWGAYFITVVETSAKEEIRNGLREYGFDDKKEWSELEFVIYCYARSLVKQIPMRERGLQREKENYFFVYRMSLGLGGVESWLCDIGENLAKEYGKRVKLLTGMTGNNIVHTLYRTIEYDFGDWDYYNSQKVEDIFRIYIDNLPTTICLNLLDESFVAAVLAKLLFPMDIFIISVVHNSTKKMIEMNISANEYIDKYCVVSDYIQMNLIQGGVNEKKIYYMSLPVAVNKELNRSYSSANSPIRIGFAGRMDGFENSQKRLDLLIRLIEQLNEKNVRFEFSFAGDGPAFPELKRMIRERKDLTGKVRFLGRISRRDILTFWRQQDICVNMADFEGHSISISEAMANGAVPVVTDVSGVRDDIEDGWNGYIVPKGDYYEAAKKIQFLYNNRLYLRDMGVGAHNVIYEKNRLDKHIAFWKSVLKNKGSEYE